MTEEGEDRGDPFEELDDVADREGDPFEYLGGPETDEGAGDAPDAPEGLEGFGPAGDPAGATRGGGAGAADSDPEAGSAPGGGPREGPGPAVPDPGDVADLDEADDRPGDPFAGAESAFQEMDVGDLEPDAVWSDLADAQDRGSVTEVRDRTYAEVDKHRYCESCEYFSAPLEISCGHGGTEILAFPDLETVRVVDCPVVEERRELEDEA